MDLNQTEAAVATQHLMDMRQEKDSWLHMPGFGNMADCLDLNPHSFNAMLDVL